MGDATAKHAGDVAQVKLFKAGQGESMLATLRSDLQATADQRMAAGVSDGSALRPASEYTAWDTEGWAGVNPGMDRWHEFLSAAVAKAKAGKQATEAEDRESFSRLKALMHPQVRFHPPTYWKPKEGSLFAAVILREVSQVFGGSFRYHRQFQDEAGLNFVLEFSAMIEDLPCLGLDIIEFDKNGDDARIVDFKVVIRPPEAGLRLKRIMSERVGKVMKELSKGQGARL